MRTVGKNIVHAARFICKLRGGSQPVLIEATDGSLFVLKFKDNCQGPNVLYNEAAGTELFKACGLGVAPWKPVLVTRAFLDRNPGCWFDSAYNERIRPEAGLCFGSYFLGAPDVRLLEVLPGISYKRIRNRTSFWLAWLIDICGEHADNRQALFRETERGRLEVTFVDMGHLFGGPNGDRRPHLLTSCYLDPRIYADITSNEVKGILRDASRLDMDRLQRRLEMMPDEWKQSSAVRGLERCLNRLGSNGSVRRTLDRMLDAHKPRGEREHSATWADNSIPRALLHPRISPRAVRTEASLARAACGARG